MKAEPAGVDTLTNLSLSVLRSSPAADLSLVLPLGTAAPSILTPGTMCLSSTLINSALSPINLFRLSTGTLSKAALVGAKTVNGPGAASLSIMPAALRAVWRVEKCSFSAIRAATLLLGPGLTVVCCC